MTTNPVPVRYTCRDCRAEDAGDRWNDPGRCRTCGGSRWEEAPLMLQARHIIEIPRTDQDGW